ncbi:MAG TPA: ATP-dependent Clp protease proteolytic subunit, partial [Puia sp.]|nr:ATP-dependent Clp protease proteolytic subunit [Puia sp.]
MNRSKYILNPYYSMPMRSDDEPDEQEPKEDKPSDMGMLMKRLEKYFFESRSVQLWGVVDDRSAKDIVNKLLLLDADKPGEEIRFFINSPGGVVTSGMAIYDTMKLIKS